MLHDALKTYLDVVEQAILCCDGVYVERYTEEILTPERVNLRIRMRFANGYLLEIHEAVIIVGQRLTHLDYRYHCQDAENRLLFRYDCTPHFPDLSSFPHHKHLPDSVIVSERTEIPSILQEIVQLQE
ncbi:toxin TumE [Methylotuvimicrobium alcaliphilum]|uniref:Uncharacterized protein n=1 Tax=Methylotuvimicrobium alcaliphilum (strain DSM 19304 / NCIMB 14124 / VKM B-2133 / 20Z) TaxID=1091494 RepID=G4SXQ8_META2|nr:DUF6516 family protein [Methylotuvimicrobium alcaliphilum]CCE22113.1 conserved protein of unknown function [Methylotuvimicrobium alcaliphilum 20Z]